MRMYTISPLCLGCYKCFEGINIGSPVDLLEHGLQTGTRALESGCDEETAVCALLHDIGEVLAPACHGEVGKVQQSVAANEVFDNLNRPSSVICVRTLSWQSTATVHLPEELLGPQPPRDLPGLSLRGRDEHRQEPQGPVLQPRESLLYESRSR